MSKQYTTFKPTVEFSELVGKASKAVGLSKVAFLELSVAFQLKALVKQGKLPKEWKELAMDLIPDKGEVSDTTLLHCYAFLKLSVPKVNLHPSVMKYVENSLTCKLALLHSFVLNTIVIQGKLINAPGYWRSNEILFKLSLSEREGVRQYLKYYDKKLKQLKPHFKDKRLLKLVNELRRAVK